MERNVITERGGRPAADDHRGELIGASSLMLLVGLVVGVAIGALSVARPLHGELASVRAEMAEVQHALTEIAGKNGQVWRTNTLLGGLAAQEKEFDAAAETLRLLGRFRADVDAEGRRALATLSSLDVLATLNDAVVAEAGAARRAGPALETIRDVHQDVRAAAIEAGIAAEAVEDLVAVRDRAIDAAGSADVARDALDTLIELHDDVVAEGRYAGEVDAAIGEIAAANTEAVRLAARVRKDSEEIRFAGETLAEVTRVIVDDAADADAAVAEGRLLVMLRDAVACTASSELTATAFERAGELLAVAGRLGGADVDLDAVGSNLDGLLVLGEIDVRTAESSGDREQLAGPLEGGRGQLARGGAGDRV
ncbi:MAG: hypothetical protein AAGJ97_04640, partial [Planctomycetota bacterium]